LVLALALLPAAWWKYFECFEKLETNVLCT